MTVLSGLDFASKGPYACGVREFHRRQRQANLLVAGSLAAAFLLTLGGFVLIANLVSSEPAKSDKQYAAPLDVNRVAAAGARGDDDGEAA